MVIGIAASRLLYTLLSLRRRVQVPADDGGVHVRRALRVDEVPVQPRRRNQRGIGRNRKESEATDAIGRPSAGPSGDWHTAISRRRSWKVTGRSGRSRGEHREIGAPPSLVELSVATAHAGRARVVLSALGFGRRLIVTRAVAGVQPRAVIVQARVRRRGLQGGAAAVPRLAEEIV